MADSRQNSERFAVIAREFERNPSSIAEMARNAPKAARRENQVAVAVPHAPDPIPSSPPKRILVARTDSEPGSDPHDSTTPLPSSYLDSILHTQVASSHTVSNTQPLPSSEDSQMSFVPETPRAPFHRIASSPADRKGLDRDNRRALMYWEYKNDRADEDVRKLSELFGLCDEELGTNLSALKSDFMEQGWIADDIGDMTAEDFNTVPVDLDPVMQRYARTIAHCFCRGWNAGIS
ncbi:unnamed protein product [Zymoseptoria tritici ST99CH_1E4]|uniref:Uncharacterized protein n=1 Tax=Zymoseptoria tritici ST99CH_1E4 TaxID=1276532 RepID=A0A2H1FZP1_ZYMTR|nr:unnamed protein product [Zymoseptoria tritici ST99CH_1E4]